MRIEDIDGGGVASPQGFRAAGVHAGFRAEADRLDMALVVADEPCACAATFTQNVFCAAPVQVSRAHLNEGGACGEGDPAYGTARAVLVNSGVANAATGERGLETARASARLAARVIGCTEQEVLVASTGVIGQHLPLAPFESGLPLALCILSRDGGASAARAIMTTDTRPKEAACTFTIDAEALSKVCDCSETAPATCGNAAVSVAGDGSALPCAPLTFTIGGMSKGAGMIMPNMATMIAVLTTDAPIAAPHLHAALKRAVAVSFNKITVDSDTSTNDSCFLLASGAAAPRGLAIEPETPAFAAFEEALRHVCVTLARAMAADGEGATRLVTVRVEGAASDADADAAARTVANSPLVKTAVYGHDANWGRIAAALGRSGARFNQKNVEISIMGMPVCKGGLTVPFDEGEALRRFEAPEIVLDINLGAGNASATMWTCDFSHDYVTINGDYRT